MVGKPREIIMDFRMSFCPSRGPMGVSSGSGCGRANRVKYQPQVILDMNSHPPVLNTAPPKPPSKGPSRGEGQLWSCFRNMYNYMKSGSQSPVTWVNPGLVQQFPPSLLQESVYPEAPYPLPEASTGVQNMPLWYAATPGSNMDYQEPLHSVMYQDKLQSDFKVIPNHKGGLSKPSKPLNPEAKEWVPSNFYFNGNTMSSTPSCSVLSSTNVKEPLVITTAVAVGFVEFTDEEINEVSDEKVKSKNLHENSTQNCEKNTSKSSQIHTSQTNKNVIENCRWDATPSVEAWKNMKNEIQKKSCEIPETDLQSMEIRNQGNYTKEVNVPNTGVSDKQALQQVNSGSYDQSHDNIQCSYASITRKSPEPQKSIEVSVEKKQAVPIIFTKDKKYPKEKAAPFIDCKKREPLPFKTASKKQKNSSKTFLKELKEQSPVKNSFSYSGSDTAESDPEIQKLCGSGSSMSSRLSSPTTSPQEMVSVCTPRTEKAQHNTRENVTNIFNRTTSESSTSSIDIEFEDCNISCDSVESDHLPPSGHPNSILAHILGLDSESEDEEEEESEDDWDSVTGCGNIVLDDSWETFGLTVNLTPKIGLPHSSKDCVDGSQSENSCDSICSNNLSNTNMEEVNDRWKKEVIENIKPASANRVHFGEINVHPMITWSYAYKNARRGPWEQYARDRARFSSRIATVEAVLNPVLESRHREAIYCKLYG